MRFSGSNIKGKIQQLLEKGGKCSGIFEEDPMRGARKTGIGSVKRVKRISTSREILKDHYQA